MVKKDFSLSTFTSTPKTKAQQEQHVGEILADGYEKATGIRVEGHRKSPSEPPDRLFEWQGLTVGVEMFEFDSFYGSRALFDQVTAYIYDAFDARVTDDRYASLHVQMATDTDLSAPTRVRTRLRQSGLRLRDVAEQLVDLVISSVPSCIECEKTDWFRSIKVDPVAYPAIAAISTRVYCSRTNPDHPKPYHNSPYVVPVASIFAYTDEDMIRETARVIERKAHSRDRWFPVDHSILVAHDFPRAHVYLGLGRGEWENWLSSAIQRTRALEFFDEVWLVDSFDREARRIAGGDPVNKGKSGR